MLGQLFLASNVNMFAKQGMDRSTRTPALSQVRAVCTQREPTGRVIIVIVTERREERKRGREGWRESQREKRTPSSLLPVCRFTTSLCVPAPRPHAEKHVRRAHVETHLRVVRAYTVTF